MGFKCKIIVIIVTILLLSIILVTTCCISLKKENYSEKLIRVLRDNESITVQDVFLFNFERAYIFDDCYISGEGFAKRYNLNISINEVNSGVSENIQRIVFVDSSGNFVYEFKCDISEIIFFEKGIVIYPETKIEITSSIQEKPITISFHSSEYYNP